MVLVLYALPLDQSIAAGLVGPLSNRQKSSRPDATLGHVFVVAFFFDALSPNACTRARILNSRLCP